MGTADDDLGYRRTPVGNSFTWTMCQRMRVADEKVSMMAQVNVGFGSDIRIIDLARLVCRIAAPTGEIPHDLAKPDSMLNKLVSASKMNAPGWKPSIGLEDGIRAVYTWFNHAQAASG